MIQKLHRKLWLAFCLLCIAVAASAGNGFSPKPYSFKDVVMSSKLTVNIAMTDIFEYPDGLPGSTSLDELGVKVEVVPADRSLIDLYKYEYYSYGKMQTLYLWRMPGKAGDTDVTVRLEYNGETVENVLHFSLLALIASDDSFSVQPGQASSLNVMGNDKFMNRADRGMADITIDRFPEYGSVNIVEGKSCKEIFYVPYEDVENYSFDELGYTVSLPSGEKSSATARIVIHKNAYASRIIEYLPAPGQFTNTMNNPDVILGNSNGMISLGSFGGYVIVGFDQPVRNDPRNPYGVDFSVKGNSFIANLYGVWSEPGAVQVMKDLNGNGLPDDGEWYELAGSDYWLSTTRRNVTMTYYNPHYNKRYTVPWVTDRGEAGAVLTNNFHNQPYYPDPYIYGCNRDSVSFTGSIIRSSLDMSSPSYIEFYRAPAFGYCDNRGYNKSDLTKACNPYYNDQRGSATDGFDISWAVDKDGNHVELDQIDFVKIYCAGSANAGWLGEWSTEVLGVAITTPEPDYVPQDYYINYIGITQLQVLKGQQCRYEGFLFKNGRPSEEGTPHWWLSDESVGKIDQTGLFTALEEGTTWIYFQQKEDVLKDSVQISVVTLKSLLIELEGNGSTVSNDSTEMIVGETIFLNAECEDSRSGKLNGRTANRYVYEPMEWWSSDKEVCTVDNGSVKALKTGRTMIYARSVNVPELVDSILVKVSEVPPVVAKSDCLYVTESSLSGKKSSKDMFACGNDATVYIDGVSAMNGGNVSVSGNAFEYGFSPEEYGICDSLMFRLTGFGRQYDIVLPVAYVPETAAMGSMFLYNVADTAANAMLAAYDLKTKAADTIVPALMAGRVSQMLPDGAFVYVAGDGVIKRVEMPERRIVAEAALESAGYVRMAVSGNTLAVALCRDGKSSLQLMHKTDLVPFGTFDIDGAVKAMTVAGGKAVVMSGKDSVGIVSVIDMNSLEVETHDVECRLSALQSFGVKQDTLVYALLADKEKQMCSLLSYNTVSHEYAVKELQTDCPENPFVIVPPSGNMLLVSSGDGFAEYDVRKGEFTSNKGVMSLPGGYIPARGCFGSGSYMIDYLSPDGDSHKAVVYSSRYSKTAELGELDGKPGDVTYFEGVKTATRPVANDACTPVFVCHERASEAPEELNVERNVFLDKEDDFTMSFRGSETTEGWLSASAADGSGVLKLVAAYAGDLGRDSVVTFVVEAVDKMGYSQKRTFGLAVMPRIYDPAVIARDISMQQGDEDMAIGMKDMFSYPAEDAGELDFSLSVTGNTNEGLLSATADGGNVVISLNKGFFGKSEITVRLTIKHEKWGVKTYDASFTVTVEEKSVEGVSGDVLYVYPNPAADFVSVNAGCVSDITVFDMAGKPVMELYEVQPGGMIDVSRLPSGCYIMHVSCEDGKDSNLRFVKV